jgi:dipeptidyl aminopeptidase/acylaminoacyl peptidase
MRPLRWASFTLVFFCGGRSLADSVAADVPHGAAAARDAELAKKAEAVLNAYFNAVADFSPDGRAIAFASTRDGFHQIYVAVGDRPDAQPLRIVTADRADHPKWTRDGKSIVFVSDHKGDELWSIWRVGPDGSGLAELATGGNLPRDPPFLPTSMPNEMVYSAHDPSGAALVYRQMIAPSAPKLVYKGKVAGWLVDVSTDGKLGALITGNSWSNLALQRVDLTSGTASKLYPISGTASVLDASFSPDGRRVYVATDGGGEQALVLALDTSTGRELARYIELHPATAMVADVRASPRGDVVAVALSVGEHVELRILDATSLRPTTRVALPLGSGFPSRFSPDGRLTFTLSTLEGRDVWSVDTRTGRAAPLRAEPKPALTGLASAEVSTIHVTSFDGTQVPVNVYLPARAHKKLPVIVDVHGGPYATARIEWNPMARFFVGEGYAFVQPNIRGSTGFGRAYEIADNGHKRMDAIRDLEAVRIWVGKQLWADDKRVVIEGGSYGGYVTLMALAHQPKLWRAGIDQNGMVNLRSVMETVKGDLRQALRAEFGDPDTEGPFLDEISPLSSADKIVAPLFVYQGVNDPRVPKSESDQIVQSLRARKVPVEYMLVGDEGHALEMRANGVALFSRVARFLETYAR